MVIKVHGIEFLFDNDRYYIIKEWRSESYAGGSDLLVPIIEREINDKEYKNLLKYLREKKMKRILRE